MTERISQVAAKRAIEEIKLYAKKINRYTLQLISLNPVKQRTLKKIRKRSKQLLNLTENLEA